MIWIKKWEIFQYQIVKKIPFQDTHYLDTKNRNFFNINLGKKIPGAPLSGIYLDTKKGIFFNISPGKKSPFKKLQGFYLNTKTRNFFNSRTEKRKGNKNPWSSLKWNLSGYQKNGKFLWILKWEKNPPSRSSRDFIQVPKQGILNIRLGKKKGQTNPIFLPISAPAAPT